MKLFFSIMAAWSVGLAGLTAAFGFDLPKATPDKGTPYSFGHHYDYDNAGSDWNHERVNRHPGYRHHYSRWYYHYGHKPQPYKKHRYYPYEKYGYYPSFGYRNKTHIYSRHTYGTNKYAPKGYTDQKHMQLRDRIPSHGFNHTRSFNRVGIGR